MSDEGIAGTAQEMSYEATFTFLDGLLRGIEQMGGGSGVASELLQKCVTRLKAREMAGDDAEIACREVVEETKKLLEKTYDDAATVTWT